jgi:hypothetical protein
MAFDHSSVTLPGRFSDAIIRQRVNTLKIRDLNSAIFWDGGEMKVFPLPSRSMTFLAHRQ